MAAQDLECWFLTGSQELYGHEVLAQVEEQSKQVVAMLGSGRSSAWP